MSTGPGYIRHVLDGVKGEGEDEAGVRRNTSYRARWVGDAHLPRRSGILSGH